MRIVTWNANMAFRNKQRILVERLNPDVAFIQECEHPDKFKENLFSFAIWKGENQDKGIAVFY
jgi:exonuclease III